MKNKFIMKKKRAATKEEIIKLRNVSDLIYKLYNKVDSYPYEMYTLLSSYAIKEKIPFDMDTHLKVLNLR